MHLHTPVYVQDESYLCFLHDIKHCFLFFSPQTGEKSGQVEKSKKNARQRQNDFKVSGSVTLIDTKTVRLWFSHSLCLWKCHLTQLFVCLLCVL